MPVTEQIKEVWNRLPSSGRIATIGAAVATIGLIGAIVYFGSQPDYSVLFSNLKPEDAQTIVEKLKTANVPYSLANNGTTIQVPSEKVPELRLQMAGEGVISGGHVGFDLFDKTNFGATDFAQQVNYRRAIEGELSRTLESMDEVESVRVHITPRKESVFTEKDEGAKASVMLRVKQGKELSAERTDAVVSLVASSVEGLDPSNISVMDTRGRLLSAPGRGKSGGLTEAGAFNAQLEAKQKYEAETASRVLALLEPVVGENRVRADVAADVDFSQVEQTEERYNPQSQVVRSQQVSNETRTTTGAAPGGLTGVRANDPTLPANPNAPPPQTAQQQQQQGNNRNSTTTNYEIDKTTKRTIGGGGRVNRMTVSVALDYKNVDGVEAIRTPEEIKQIQDLVAAAVGVDANRGDSVVVQTLPFNKVPELPATTTGWLEQNKPLVGSGLKYGALVLVAVMLLFFVVRPAKKALRTAAALPAAVETGSKLLAEGDGKRLEDMTKEEIEAKELAAIEPMMTVAEIEAKINGNDSQNLLTSEAEDAGEEIARLQKVKTEVIRQTLDDTEVVVGTLRSWLRES